MKYKNKFFKISNLLILGLLVSILISCADDFLDNTDKTNLNDNTQWESENTADLFLNDIYNSVPNKGNEPENLDNFTDDNDAGFYYTSYNWKSGIVTPNASGFEVWGGTSGPTDHANWASTYTKVRKCNLFIQK